MRCPPSKNREVIYIWEPIPHDDRIDQSRSYCQMSTRKQGPAADAGQLCPVTDLPSVSARQRTPNGMGWQGYRTPHHDLINQNRFFCRMLINKRDSWQMLAAAAPLHLSIADSGHSGQRVTASYRHGVIPSRRHTVTASYRRSCTPSPAPQGNVNKGRLVVSRLTSPPCYRH